MLLSYLQLGLGQYARLVFETSISNRFVFDVFLTVKSFATLTVLLNTASKSIVKFVFVTSISNRFVFDEFLTVKSFATLTELLNTASKSIV